MQTSNPQIWAAGDVTGYPQFTHTAGVHASTAASNPALGLRRTVATATIARVTFTQPEIAAFGVRPDRGGKAAIADVQHGLNRPAVSAVIRMLTAIRRRRVSR